MQLSRYYRVLAGYTAHNTNCYEKKRKMTSNAPLEIVIRTYLQAQQTPYFCFRQSQFTNVSRRLAEKLFRLYFQGVHHVPHIPSIKYAPVTRDIL